MKSLGYTKVKIVGHDIGLMVAYAYAAQYPAEVDRIVLMDAFLPGVGDWKNVWLLRDLWHFHFYGKTPLALVTGRERIYLEHFWNDFAANPAKSISQKDRKFYAKAYAAAGTHEGGDGSLPRVRKGCRRFCRLCQDQAAMPMLVLSGEKGGRAFPDEQGKLVATNVEGVIVKGSGHWLMEEAPGQVIPKLVDFLNR